MTTMISSGVNRSYLFAPGHNAKLLQKVFTAGADAVILDLEDGSRPTRRTARGRWSPRRCGSTPRWCG